VPSITKHVPGVLITTIWLLSASSTPVTADAVENYRRGLEAIERENWETAIDRLREAIAENPKAGRRVKIYGMRYERYLPYFHLGLALHRHGDCQAALDAWSKSEKQGAIKKDKRHRILLESRESCSAQMKAATPRAAPTTDPSALAQAAARAKTGIDRARDAESAVTTLRESPDLAAYWSGDDAAARTIQNAATQLSSARRLLERGRAESSVSLLDQANARAQTAYDSFEKIRSAAMAHRSKPESTPTPRTLRIAERPSKPAAPATLLSAAKAFFSGRYDEVLSILHGSEMTHREARLQAYLLRAASSYSLYQLDGERKRAYLSAASRDVRSCKELNPRFRPDERAFSPRFLRFFDSVR
jgi:tetratricopeptide (TPR) repeat protein